ncbi:MAG: Ig-like domain-containing protein, partial [Gemmatimonadota bacterium]|nr:Ig-like domain-containing protein [Gemmatimonadota bacterium]
MKHLAPILLLAFAACSGGGNSNGGGSTGPKPVASVSVTAATTQISVGQQLALNFIALDASGAALTGRTVAWTSSNNLVATVTTTGIVSGVSPGTATITATVEGKVGSTVITVQAVQTACAGATPLSLSVGEVRLLTGTDRSAICLTGGTSASEYMLLAFNNSLDTTGQALGVKLDATNTAQAVGLPAAALVAQVTPGPTMALDAAAMDRRLPTRSFDVDMRQRERREFGPGLRGGNRTAAYARLRASRGAGGLSPGAPSLIRGLAASPAVGDLVTLNTNAFSSCSNAQNSTGRVQAIGSSSIVVADTGAPAGGFTTADYQSFATTFDTLVYALDT